MSLFLRFWRTATIRRRRRSGSPYVLDGLNNVSLAYGFRRLSKFYNGPVVRLRRGLDDRELDIYLVDDFLDYEMAYEFQAQSTLYAVRAYDHSGNGRDAYQPDPALQPEFDLSVAALNSYPALKGRPLSFLHTDYDIPHSATLLMAYGNYTDGSLYGGFMGGFFPFMSEDGWRPNSGGPPEFPFSDNDTLNNHNACVLYWDYDSDIYQAWLDGVQRIDETTPVDYPLAGGNPGQVQFMAGKNSGAEYLVGHLGEVVLVDGQMPAGRRDGVGERWAQTFGFTWG